MRSMGIQVSGPDGRPDLVQRERADVGGQIADRVLRHVQLAVPDGDLVAPGQQPAQARDRRKPGAYPVDRHAGTPFSVVSKMSAARPHGPVSSRSSWRSTGSSCWE